MCCCSGFAHFLMREMALIYVAAFATWTANQHLLMASCSRSVLIGESGVTFSREDQIDGPLVSPEGQSRIREQLQAARREGDMFHLEQVNMAVRRECWSFHGSILWVSVPCFVTQALFWLYAVIRCFIACPCSFGSMKYLQFTWDLETSRGYRCLVYLMAVVVLGTMVCVCSLCSRFYEPLTMLYALGYPYAVLLAVVYFLFRPVVPAYRWKKQAVDSVRFKRSKLDFFLQSNDAFGVKMVGALWRAELGDDLALAGLLWEPRKPCCWEEDDREQGIRFDVEEVWQLLCDLENEQDPAPPISAVPSDFAESRAADIALETARSMRRPAVNRHLARNSQSSAFMRREWARIERKIEAGKSVQG